MSFTPGSQYAALDIAPSRRSGLSIPCSTSASPLGSSGLFVAEGDSRGLSNEYHLPRRPKQAPRRRSSGARPQPNTSPGAVIAEQGQQWVWECVWAATPLYDEGLKETVLEFYLTWIDWNKTLDRERLESFGHASWSLQKFCENVDPRCIKSGGWYKEGTMIYASTEGKRLMCLCAVESQLDLEGYWRKLARRHPADEAQFSVQWIEEDGVFQGKVEKFRLQLAAREEFDLLGPTNFKSVTDEQINTMAHDYVATKGRRLRSIRLKLRPSPPDTASRAQILYDEIFGSQTYIKALQAGYLRQRDSYIRRLALLRDMGTNPDETADVGDTAEHFADVIEQPFNVDDFYENEIPQIEFSAHDGWPITLKRMAGSELWFNKTEFSPQEKRDILRVVASTFTLFAVRSASKKYRSPVDNNHACKIMNDDETRADCCTECWHWMNKAALLQYWLHAQKIICPYCRLALTYAPFTIAAISPPVRTRRTKTRGGAKVKRRHTSSAHKQDTVSEEDQQDPDSDREQDVEEEEEGNASAAAGRKRTRTIAFGLEAINE